MEHLDSVLQTVKEIGSGSDVFFISVLALATVGLALLVALQAIKLNK